MRFLVRKLNSRSSTLYFAIWTYGSLQGQSGKWPVVHCLQIIVNCKGTIRPRELEPLRDSSFEYFRGITSTSASFDSDTVGVINSPVPHMEEFAHFDSEISYGMHFVELGKRGSGEW